MDWSDYDAALFDLDGVITPTAEVHMRAWNQMFNDFLTARGVEEPYTDDDYYRYVDGKPRYDGVRSFLASRDIELPEGTPDDAPEEETVGGLGNRKNVAFEEVLDRDGVVAYPGSVALVEQLAAAGTQMAIVSSSRNAPKVLRAAGLIDHFPVIVDGVVAGDRQLAGKPAPDTFLFAAQQLDVEPSRAVVLEDATSGVAAGHAGRFGLVVGVDRGAGADALREHGADEVVSDLRDLL
ncbi:MULTISPECIES: HAD family phosphatase [unclassified Aeromicrobium]|uniref:HAD family hydrolase n=2 Tax=Aeromicrobium TaxID=2040 RepID=UPI0006F50C75|nr:MULTISPECIES: beta-phosphoglucomutase family hydrolase [unclassified Aeromicrobium]KQO39495.1 haloacid dehalogenase [Aeromicrobium sp. Leaf245]KQP78012.1 haloacid dehalogenase [Aeromicrobium sp. Leaf289]KQP83676.1 haloacid dehalogenase [Aeromicrobium sp. Leaf291]